MVITKQTADCLKDVGVCVVKYEKHDTKKDQKDN